MYRYQREFARAAGIANGTINVLERDETYVPTLYIIAKISDYLGIDRMELVKKYFEVIDG